MELFEGDECCSACGASIEDSSDCDPCGGAVCNQCHRCEDCDKAIAFSHLPEDYFHRTCAHCKGQMNVNGLKIDEKDSVSYSEAVSMEPIRVHRGCLEQALAANDRLKKAYAELGMGSF